MNFSPIALFVYNRLVHTQKTVEALKKNSEAQSSVLYIFSDAPKSSIDENAVSQVRNYLKKISGFKEIFIIERNENYGLAKSIIDGVTDLCNRFGRVIVLEDDLETSAFFLKFMNDSLEFFKNENQIMHVSGCRYPVESFESTSTFFLMVPLCWGWATWQRAWCSFDKNISIMKEFDRQMISEFDFDDSYGYWSQLELNKSGKINSWFVFWYANIFLQRKLSLFPSKSLVKNIGHDGTGVHCGGTSDYDVVLSLDPIVITPIPIKLSNDAYLAHVKYFRKINSHKLIERILRKINVIFRLNSND